MQLYEDIKKSIESNMIQFFEFLVDKKSNFSKEELVEKWKEFNEDVNKKNKSPIMIQQQSTTIKKSGYQNFFAQKRMEIKAKNPSIAFAELSKIISMEWNKLSQEEKNTFIHQIPQMPPNNFTLEELNSKKMSELKALCESIGIKKSGNKTELIKNLLGNTVTPEEEKKEKIITPIDKPDTSLDIYVSSKKEKRSDFEVTESIDENEFSFDEDDISDTKYDDSESENTIQDDDEEDLFVDEN
jgi:hypothetical protein